MYVAQDDAGDAPHNLLRAAAEGFWTKWIEPCHIEKDILTAAPQFKDAKGLKEACSSGSPPRLEVRQIGPTLPGAWDSGSIWVDQTWLEAEWQETMRLDKLSDKEVAAAARELPIVNGKSMPMLYLVLLICLVGWKNEQDTKTGRQKAKARAREFWKRIFKVPKSQKPDIFAD